MRFFVDLDGVLVDLWQGVADTFDLPVFKLVENARPEDGGNLVPAMVRCGCFRTDEEGWAEMTRFFTEAPIGWWESLPAFVTNDLLLELLRQYQTAGPLMICSRVVSPLCEQGKRAWLERNLREWHAQGFETLLCSNKAEHAKPGYVLIDDSDGEVQAFRQKGGKGIVFPRPWNSGVTLDGWMETLHRDISAIVMAGRSA